MLEPGGNFYVKRKDPGIDEVRHGELLKQLEALGKQLAAVEAALKRS